MAKLILIKDPSHKGYYQDVDGNLYVFRFGGRPIKVDGYREDKPNENYNNNKVEVEKSEVIDHRKSATVEEDKKFLAAAEEEFKNREREIKESKKYEVKVTDNNHKRTLETKTFNNEEDANRFINQIDSNKYDYEYKNKSLSDLEVNHLESRQKRLVDEINNTEERKAQKESEFITNKDIPDKSLTQKERKERAEKEVKEINRISDELEDKEKMNHFAGWELYSDDPNRFGDKLRNYNEKMNPKTYTEKLLESERATSNYQKAKVEYDKAWEKYRDVDFNDKNYEKYKSLKDEAQEKYNIARKEAINKFNETIPYQEMFKTGTEIVGVNTKFTEPIMDEKGYVKYQSEDIRSQCGAFGKVLKECRLTQFNSSISFDEKTNEPFYWGSMDLSYQLNEGGSNGMRIMDYTYSNRNGWEMKDTKGNIYHNGRELKSASELAEYFEGRGYTKETAMNKANQLIANRKN